MFGYLQVDTSERLGKKKVNSSITISIEFIDLSRAITRSSWVFIVYKNNISFMYLSNILWGSITLTPWN